MFEMKVDNHCSSDGKVRIVLSGEIDISTAPEFKTRLYELIGDGTKDIELICDRLSYIDSTGLGILVGALKRVKNHQNNVYIYPAAGQYQKAF